MTNEKNDVYKSYEKIATWFDEHRCRDLFEKPWLDKVISHLQLGAKILDLGCGLGEPIGQYFADCGFQVTGIDASKEMLEIAKKRCPNIKFILSDMRELNLPEKFDAIIAWHSFFHLPANDQQRMFSIFTNHLNEDGILFFTSGIEAGEFWGNNGGENLYHASLAIEDYKEILKNYSFKLIDHQVSDPECGGATVWLAQYKIP